MKLIALTSIILVTLTSINSFACMNQIPASEAQRIISALPSSVSDVKSCSEIPSEECLCFDKLEGWDVAEIQEFHFENDIDKPIMDKTNILECSVESIPEQVEGEEPVEVVSNPNDCYELLAKQVCEEPSKGYISQDLSEVYCSKVTGYEQKKVYQKKLVNNAEKMQIAVDKAAAKKAIEYKIAIGKLARNACQSVLDLISGYNIDRELSAEQVTAMQVGFSDIEKALQSNRPSSAKQLISQVTVDGVVVTQEMKDIALELLKDF
jgi:hypothetical protein